MGSEQDIEEAAVHWERARIIDRNEVIEECARVAELVRWFHHAGDPNLVIAAAIRTLKGEP